VSRRWLAAPVAIPQMVDITDIMRQADTSQRPDMQWCLDMQRLDMQRLDMQWCLDMKRLDTQRPDMRLDTERLYTQRLHT
jgi:hypothetical protein